MQDWFGEKSDTMSLLETMLSTQGYSQLVCILYPLAAVANGTQGGSNNLMYFYKIHGGLTKLKKSNLNTDRKDAQFLVIYKIHAGPSELLHHTHKNNRQTHNLESPKTDLWMVG